MGPRKNKFLCAGKDSELDCRSPYKVGCGETKKTGEEKIKGNLRRQAGPKNCKKGWVLFPRIAGGGGRYQKPMARKMLYRTAGGKRGE